METVAASSLETLTGATGTLFSLAGDIMTNIISNPVFVVFFATALIGVGIAIFKKIRGAAK